MGVTRPHIVLTRVSYPNRQCGIPSISATLDLHKPLSQRDDVIIKRNIFGHRWVLQLDQRQHSKQTTNKLQIVYIIVFIAIILAFTFGLVIYFGSKYLELNLLCGYKVLKKVPIFVENNRTIFNIHKNYSMNLAEIISNKTYYQISEGYKNNISKVGKEINDCSKCDKNKICLQENNSEYPKCVEIKDHNDPTGCGGLCKLNTQYCKQLDEILQVFNCIDIPSFTCAETEWKCEKTLMCIPEKYRCDGIIHCFDKSDEINCNCDINNYFHCGDSISCIHISKKCNGAIDCWDAYDEMNCTHDCGSLAVPCYNGQCIAKDKYCDGIIDCQDKSDEPQGCTKNCGLNQQRCRNGSCASVCSDSENCEDALDKSKCK